MKAKFTEEEVRKAILEFISIRVLVGNRYVLPE